MMSYSGHFWGNSLEKTKISASATTTSAAGSVDILVQRKIYIIQKTGKKMGRLLIEKRNLTKRQMGLFLKNYVSRAE